MSIQIRPVQLEDAGALTVIIREPGLFARFENEVFEVTCTRVQQALQQMLNNDGHSLYLAEEDESQVLGYVSVHWTPYLILNGPEGYVSELFVLGAARGRGIGRQLLETVQEEGRQRGCSRLGLLNMRTRESYQRGFYAGVGWQERPEAANFVYLYH